MDFGILIEKSLDSEVGQKLRLTSALSDVRFFLEILGKPENFRAEKSNVDEHRRGFDAPRSAVV